MNNFFEYKIAPMNHENNILADKETVLRRMLTSNYTRGAWPDAVIDANKDLFIIQVALATGQHSGNSVDISTSEITKYGPNIREDLLKTSAKKLSEAIVKLIPNNFFSIGPEDYIRYINKEANMVGQYWNDINCAKPASEQIKIANFPSYMVDPQVGPNSPTSWVTAIKNLRDRASMGKNYYLVAYSRDFFESLNIQYEVLNGVPIFGKDADEEIVKLSSKYYSKNSDYQETPLGEFRLHVAKEEHDGELLSVSRAGIFFEYTTFYYRYGFANNTRGSKEKSRFLNIFSPATPDEQIEEMDIPGYAIPLESCISSK